MSQLHPRPFVPFLVACAGIATFSLMDAAMKDLALELGAYNAVIWRNSLGALLMGVLFIATRQKWPAIGILKIHLWRSIVVSAMAVSFFWSLTKLPLAEAIGLSFIAPVIALYLAAVMLGERIGREAIWASLAGLVGVAIIMAGRLSGDYDEGHIWGAAAVLFSAVVFAYNLILARRQAQIAGPIEIAFFQNLFVAVTLSLAAPWFLEPFSVSHAPMIGGGGSVGDHLAVADELGLCAGRGADIDSGRIYRLCLGGPVRLAVFCRTSDAAGAGRDSVDRVRQPDRSARQAGARCDHAG